MNVQELTDVELNRAMIWLYPRKEYQFNNYDNTCTFFDTIGSPYLLDYLSSWNLTMPLAVEHSVEMALYPDESFAEILNYDYFGFSRNKNPLRAICEVLVMIKLGEKQ